MSDIIGPLGTFAEFSIGIAGFAGIIAAVIRSSGESAELLLFRFRNLLITAFAPGFFSIFTICLVYSNLTEFFAVRASSLLLFLYLCAWMVLVVKTGPSGLQNRFVVFFMWTVSLVNAALQVTNLVDPTLNLTGLYFFGLFLLLVQAAVVFVLMSLTAFSARS